MNMASSRGCSGPRATFVDRYATYGASLAVVNEHGELQRLWAPGSRFFYYYYVVYDGTRVAVNDAWLVFGLALPKPIRRFVWPWPLSVQAGAGNRC